MPQFVGSSAEVGDKDSTRATLRVDAEDLVPGVYEVAVQAPPNAAATYALEVALPPLAVVGGKPGETTVKNLTTHPVAARLDLEVEGMARDTAVVGSGSKPVTIGARSPAWADRLVVDVKFQRALWNTVTDFGLTVFDSTGQILSHGPMNYAFTRQVIKLDSLRRDRPLQIELFPAFAHLKAESTWSAAVRLAFLRHTPLRLPAPDSVVAVAPGDMASFPVILPDTAVDFPGGLRPLIRETVVPSEGVPSVRKETW